MADLISVEQAAKDLGVHVQTVRRFIHAGRLRAFKQAGAGNRFLVSAEDIERLKKPVPVAVVPDRDERQLVLPMAEKSARSMGRVRTARRK
jgi:excisionase family DNA binding protein